MYIAHSITKNFRSSDKGDAVPALPPCYPPNLRQGGRCPPLTALLSSEPPKVGGSKGASPLRQHSNLVKDLVADGTGDTLLGEKLE